MHIFFCVLFFLESSRYDITGIALVSCNDSPGATLITTVTGQYWMALTRTHTRIILLIKAATIAWPPHREAYTTHARVQIISRRSGPPSPPPCVLSSPSLSLSSYPYLPVCPSFLKYKALLLIFPEQQFGPSEGQRQVKFCFDDSKWRDYPNERQLSKPRPSLYPSVSLGLFFIPPSAHAPPSQAIHHIHFLIPPVLILSSSPHSS